jgi:hypothetical protein
MTAGFFLFCCVLADLLLKVVDLFCLEVDHILCLGCLLLKFLHLLSELLHALAQILDFLVLFETLEC